MIEFQRSKPQAPSPQYESSKVRLYQSSILKDDYKSSTLCLIGFLLQSSMWCFGLPWWRIDRTSGLLKFVCCHCDTWIYCFTFGTWSFCWTNLLWNPTKWNLVPEDKTEKAVEVISNTCWDIEAVKITCETYMRLQVWVWNRFSRVEMYSKKRAEKRPTASSGHRPSDNWKGHWFLPQNRHQIGTPTVKDPPFKSEPDWNL